MDEISRSIGNTGLMKLEKLSGEVGASVYVKCEAANPGASIKDRAALSMIDRAEARGEILAGETTIIEPTSGNTGIALAMIAAVRGYRIILTMPESMSRERRVLLAAYGAEVVLTPAASGMAGAVARAEELLGEIPRAWMPNQFANPDNPLAHERTTGPEILQELGVAPDYVVAAAGTGGTISGTAHFFRAQGAATKHFAVQPAESPIISQALRGEDITPAPHGIQGIGTNFIPDALDLDALEGAISVSTAEAVEAARRLTHEEGLLAGISSGANIAAVRKLAGEYPDAKGKTIVTFAVDTGERYISTPLFEGVGA